MSADDAKQKVEGQRSQIANKMGRNANKIRFDKPFDVGNGRWLVFVLDQQGIAIGDVTVGTNGTLTIQRRP